MIAAATTARQRWQRAKEIFAEVAEAPAGDRACLCDALTADDERLRAEVASLLAADARASSFLDGPAFDAVVPSLAGARLGAYRIEEEIGRGGMGTVYLAVRDDDAFRKRVAVKVIRRGMDTDAIVGRFRNERRILAQLEHPNIARLIDGGSTADGLPYFVMEWVEGVPIDAYCNGTSMPAKDRLRLFLRVCSAVHHAHQNLVIHRDLKPSNILVSSDGVPKLLDFGIAKMLAEDDPSLATTVGELRVLTPEYASPEQIAGRALRTTSDVYSLGVVLYELITGVPPYRLPSRAPAEVLQVITTARPERPSRIARTAADLDNIVARAMHVDPERRYASVQELADDVERYLSGRPVAARGDSLSYRAKKFVARNKVAVSAAVLVLIAACGGVGAMWHAERTAERAQIVERQRLEDVRGIAASVMFELHDELARVPGSLVARQFLVSRSAEYLDRLAQESGGDPSVEEELAVAYDQVGSLTFDTARALDAHRKSARILEALVATQPHNPRLRAELANSLLNEADTEKICGMFPAAEQTVNDAILNAGVAAEERPAVDTRLLLELADLTAGEIGDEAGRPHHALAASERALEIATSVASADPSNLEAAHRLLHAESHVGTNLTQTGNAAAALSHHQKAIAIASALVASDPRNARFRRDLWQAKSEAGPTLRALGKTREAVANLRDALSVIEDLAAADPADIGYRRVLGQTHIALGDALADAGKRDQAMAHYDAAVAISASLTAADPMRVEAAYDLIRADGGRAQLLIEGGDRVDAQRALDDARAIEALLMNRGSENPRLAFGVRRLAAALNRTNRRQAAALPRLSSDRSAANQSRPSGARRR